MSAGGPEQRPAGGEKDGRIFLLDDCRPLDAKVRPDAFALETGVSCQLPPTKTGRLRGASASEAPGGSLVAGRGRCPVAESRSVTISTASLRLA